MATALVTTLVILLLAAVVGLRWHRTRRRSQTVTMRQARLREEAAILAAYFGTWREGETPSIQAVVEIVGDLPLGKTLAEILWQEHEDGIRPPVLKPGSLKYQVVSAEIGDFCRRRSACVSS